MSFALALAAAFWLGILTSASPCPLASNIAAISFIGRRAADPRHVLLSGLFYTLGRTVAYVALGAAITAGGLAVGGAARFFQTWMNLLLGPVLILAGMSLLGLLHGGLDWHLAGERLQARAAAGGAGWAAVLGAVFALSFCPVSAALFFGALIPLALRQESRLLLPMLYGVGTALPVAAFAALAAFAATAMARVFEQLTRAERLLRFATGGIFLAAGFYYTLVHIYGWR
ncbi:MAG: aromatic aminobenezylarsenical efflux permease ArsG family transporter [Lentisphaeria bacterium]|jgi:cytochrome c biogenesis protein CcdA